MWTAADTATAVEHRRLRRATLTTLERLRATYLQLQGQAERAGQREVVIALAERLFLLDDRLARLRLAAERE